jgi:hypothetical protein
VGKFVNCRLAELLAVCVEMKCIPESIGIQLVPLQASSVPLVYCTAPAFVLLQLAAVLPTRAAPFTSRAACGVVVPMPTEPVEVKTNSVEPL